MNKEWENNFETLLRWLDADRDKAGAKYEEIRHSLINIFSWRGCREAEDLADETITRVTAKVGELLNNYSGDPALYFYGVARLLFREFSRREQRMSPVSSDELEEIASAGSSEDLEREHECLERCLSQLTSDDRELILLYYQQEHPKKDYRKQLAKRFGISPNNLRVKVHRIRTALHRCIENCLRFMDS